MSFPEPPRISREDANTINEVVAIVSVDQGPVLLAGMDHIISSSAVQLDMTCTVRAIDRVSTVIPPDVLVAACARVDDVVAATTVEIVGVDPAAADDRIRSHRHRKLCSCTTAAKHHVVAITQVQGIAIAAGGYEEIVALMSA